MLGEKMTGGDGNDKGGRRVRERKVIRKQGWKSPNKGTREGGAGRERKDLSPGRGGWGGGGN